MPKKSTKKTNKILIYFPRILSVVFTIYLSLFAFDVFSEFEFPIVLLAFLIHLTPSLILLIITLIAWKKPRTGGIAFMILSIIFTLWFNTYKTITGLLLISLPPFATGLLFYLNQKNK